MVQPEATHGLRVFDRLCHSQKLADCFDLACFLGCTFSFWHTVATVAFLGRVFASSDIGVRIHRARRRALRGPGIARDIVQAEVSSIGNWEPGFV